MCNVVVAFNRGELNSQAMQVHRKFRFIGQKLLKREYAEDEHNDGWGVIKLNHDVAVMQAVEVAVGGTGRRKKQKQVQAVWRIGNVVDIRRLKQEPKDKHLCQVSDLEVEQYSISEIDLNDPKAALQLRFYCECDGDGNQLTGYQNKSCSDLFYLPIGESIAEPCVWVSNISVIERLEMKVEPGYHGVWRAKKSHLSCIRCEFKKRSI